MLSKGGSKLVYINKERWAKFCWQLCVGFLFQFINSDLFRPTYIEGLFRPSNFFRTSQSQNSYKSESTNWHVLLVRFSILQAERERERDLKRRLERISKQAAAKGNDSSTVTVRAFHIAFQAIITCVLRISLFVSSENKHFKFPIPPT